MDGLCRRKHFETISEILGSETSQMLMDFRVTECKKKVKITNAKMSDLFYVG